MRSALRRARAARGNPLLRAVDRYAGVPLVAAAGLVKRRRPLPASVRRIGILNSTAIGDTIVLSAVARDLAAAFPEAETVLFARPALAPLLAQLEPVRTVALRITSPRETIKALRGGRFDVLLDFDSWPRIEPVYCLLSGSLFAAGFSSPGQHRHYAYDASVEHLASCHELDNFRRLASVVGVTSTSTPRLDAPGALRPEELPQRPYALFHLWPTGVQSDLKEWPAERWRELARTVVGLGRTVVLTGGPEDVARSAAFLESCSELGRELVDAAGAYGLAELVDLIAGSDCVVSVNTGIAHVAAATGTPTITLNGPTAAARWGPIGERAVSLESALDGCGYLHLGWEYDGRRRDCMRGVALAAVQAAVLEALEG